MWKKDWEYVRDRNKVPCTTDSLTQFHAIFIILYLLLHSDFILFNQNYIYIYIIYTIVFIYICTVLNITMAKSTRRTRFEKVASNRVSNILKSLDSLEKCSNRNNYEYLEEDVRKMEKALKDKLNSTLKSFSNEIDRGKDVEFKF